jgi:stage III sporulation protein AH
LKKIKKNQVIITALAIMIAVAGYINYTGNLSDIISVKDTKDASSDGVVIDENTGEIVNNDAEPDDNSLMEPGSVMLTSGSSVSDSIISEAKLNREQLRAKNKEMLMEIVNNESLDEAAKQAAVNKLADISDTSQKEIAAELLLEAKGFSNAVVSVTDGNVDVVINSTKLR